MRARLAADSRFLAPSGAVPRLGRGLAETAGAARRCGAVRWCHCHCRTEDGKLGKEAEGKKWKSCLLTGTL
ncbi:uncharacterized protein K452DRAFT_8472 [Aplosporella prunicola CBS 121167]|uniref:Uncharacterized protein n=1 Tax=Aplosporella prunicola CBS 121167 TaxID=1176127 RepID=A0A6A6BTV6_9PEZI|nr:uncharacterized protein K452DRAFT_8472 [Aplosporella prunicola CBS 121167]KAF2147516.1 hypothetical protein K452DRAFT_8472 [Aplosporella prunicola CBS 121167]